jgi:acyl-CoA synthetase (AMP-forming)/AMP-acid ligase II
MLSTPRPEFLVLFLATLRIGAIFVGLNPVHTIAEQTASIRIAKPRILFGFPSLRGRDNRQLLSLFPNSASSIEKVVCYEQAPEFGLPYSQFLQSGTDLPVDEFEAATNRTSLDDVAISVQTSGSTGDPKGALITHGNLAHCALLQHSLFPITPLRILCNVPINHTLCTCDIVAYALVGGGTIIFEERFSAQTSLAAIERERITCLIQVPAMLQRILAITERSNPYDTTSLELIFFLGAPMSEQSIRSLLRIGRDVVTGWGLTEATSSVTFTDRSDDIATIASTVGRCAPTFEIRIVTGNGSIAAPEQNGEIQVRGPCVMAGYFENPQASRLAIDEQGWLKTGDAGYIDKNSRLRFTGRIKAMYKSGGYNIYPEEVETVLSRHPAVSQVVVVPVPDPLYDEVGFAFIGRQENQALTADTIGQYCREHLANYKVPKYFDFLETFPTLAVGKFDRSALRAAAKTIVAARSG